MKYIDTNIARNRIINLIKNNYNMERQTEIEQSKEELIDEIINDKLKHEEFWSNPRNKKTRIVVEMLMRSCYLTGFNNATEQMYSVQEMEQCYNEGLKRGKQIQHNSGLIRGRAKVTALSFEEWIKTQAGGV